MSRDMHDTLRELTANGVVVNLHPEPMAGGIEYSLSSILDGLKVDKLKRVIAIVEKGDYEAAVSNGWLDLYHR